MTPTLTGSLIRAVSRICTRPRSGRLALTAALALSLSACAQSPMERPAPARAAIHGGSSPAHPDSTRNPLLFAGADIGERINAALEDCKRQCTVRLPAGN